VTEGVLRPAETLYVLPSEMERTTTRRRRRSPNLGMQPMALRAAADTVVRPQECDRSACSHSLVAAGQRYTLA
jgi:hypothetical protein